MNFFEKIIIRKKIKFLFLKLFKQPSFKRDEKKIILLEFNNWTFNHIASSYICNILSNKHQAKIEGYPGFQLIQSRLTQNFLERLKWKLGNLFSLNSWGIYKSFGVKNIFWPKFDSEIEKKAIKEFYEYKNKIRSKENLQNYKIKNILIGDLIYDSFLKKNLYSTINLNSSQFKNFVFDSIKLFFFWEIYFSKNKISSVVTFHSVYLGALPLRFSIEKNIPSYVVNFEKFYSLNKNIRYFGKEYMDFKKIFKALPKKIQENKLKFTKTKLIKRFNGYLSNDLVYVSKSAYGKTNNKRILKNSQKIKILIATHSYSDAPHALGNSFFPDIYEWLEAIGKISNYTDYEWYIKCHPGYSTYFDNTIELVKQYVKRYPNINYLDNNVSHNQLIKEGINYVLTVNGSIGGEYPFFGVNVINASKNHSQENYNFTITPKNKKEYLHMLKNLKKPKKVKKMMQILQHYYMKYEYFNAKWFFNDPNKVKYSVGGYHNLTTLVLYKYWTANFDLKAHDKKYQQLEQFINSGNYNYAAHDK